MEWLCRVTSELETVRGKPPRRISWAREAGVGRVDEEEGRPVARSFSSYSGIILLCQTLLGGAGVRQGQTQAPALLELAFWLGCGHQSHKLAGCSLSGPGQGRGGQVKQGQSLA